MKHMWNFNFIIILKGRSFRKSDSNFSPCQIFLQRESPEALNKLTQTVLRTSLFFYEWGEWETTLELEEMTRAEKFNSILHWFCKKNCCGKVKKVCRLVDVQERWDYYVPELSCLKKNYFESTQFFSCLALSKWRATNNTNPKKEFILNAPVVARNDGTCSQNRIVTGAHLFYRI